MLNGASFEPAVSPGCLISILGTGLAASDAAAGSVPLPVSLAGTRVKIGDLDASLLYVSGAQINAQIPFEISSTTAALVVVTPAGQSAPYILRLTSAAPGIFTRAANGRGKAVYFDRAFRRLDSAVPGDVIVLYATGLGVTNPPSRTGEGGSAVEPLNRAVEVPEVEIGGRKAEVLFAGLAPWLPGIYQLNLIVPSGLATDRMLLRSGGLRSNVVETGIVVAGAVYTCFVPGTTIPLLGDVNGDGRLTAEDAEQVRSWLAGSAPSLGCPGNADATEDLEITGADADAIIDRLNGRSRAVAASLEHGFPGKVHLGAPIRISALERFFPFHVTGGKARIKSASTRYGSGERNLTFERDGRSLYFQWETTGLQAAADYEVYISLTQAANVLRGPDSANQPVATLSLGIRPLEIARLGEAVDASAPSPGIQLEFRRIFPHDSFVGLYLGPLGRGWIHSFDMRLQEFTNGRIAFIAPDGLTRWFEGGPGGTYAAAPGDYATLTRDPNGSFQLRERNGFLYRFRPDLHLDFIEDRNGNRISAVYGPENRLVEVRHRSGQAFRLEYNDQGRISKLIDHVGRATTYEYDTLGSLLLRVIGPGGRVTSYAYAGGRGFAAAAADRLQTIAFPDGTHLYYAFDAEGRVASQERDGGSGRITYSYASGETRAADVAGGLTTTRVNERRQPVEVRDALGGVTRYEYDSNFNLTKMTDALGRASELHYDGKGNVDRLADPLGNQMGASYEAAFGHLASLRDARGITTAFSYDARGNLVQTVYPDGTRESYAYDSRGLLTGKTDRKGVAIKYGYDNRGLLVSKAYPDGGVVSYTYDSSGNLIRAADPAGAIEFQYDSADRLVRVTYPGGRSFGYEYDAAGKRTRMTDPDGKLLQYRYDAAGRLAGIADGAGQPVVTFEYDAAGRRSKKTLGNGAYTTYDYDVGGRLQRLTNYGPRSEVISRFAYTYDAVGKRLTKETLEGIERYEYDPLDRLTGVTYPDGKTEQFAYDTAGNRTAVVQDGRRSAYSVNNLNQYLTAGAATYRYDLNGNLVAKEEGGKTTTYAYDFENRLVRVQTPSATVVYTYDALGLRSSRSDSQGTVRYLWDGDQVATEESGAHQTAARYAWGDALDEAIRMDRGVRTFYYAQDALLSVSELLDHSGVPVERYRYRVFGEPLLASSAGNPWLFTGLAYDSQAGLQHNRSRYYLPALGRFLSPDQIGILGGTNLYTYAHGNPVLFRDPGGQLVLVGPIAAFVAVVYFLNLVFGYTSGALPPSAFRGGATATDLMHIVYKYEHAPRPMVFEIDPSSLSRSYYYKGGSTEVFRFARPAHGSWVRFEFLGGWVSVGGVCPTFIQLPSEPQTLGGSATRVDIGQQALAAKISVPVSGSLLRADIPIFGVAGGKEFKEYRVEYGEGNDPRQWHKIASSTRPQNTNDVGIAEMHLMQGDINIQGNLATWNTGLKEWVHLPWHPPEDPTDFRGEYTIRLVVTGADGGTVEDRVHVEVGRAIAQVLPGTAISTDNKLTMRFEAQSLQAPFRVYTIKPLTAQAPPLPAEQEMVGAVYTVREPGDRFLKPVVLAFDVGAEARGRSMDQLGIFGFDPKANRWELLPTTRGGSSNTLETAIYGLPSPVAYFVVLVSKTKQTQSKPPAPAGKPAVAAVSEEPFLVFDTFENDTGEWAERDREFGAVVSRDRKATPDGTYCLQITNQNAGGNFAVTVRKSPFDVEVYPFVTFDYRITPGVKTDFYVRSGPTWYNIGFTDDENDFRHKDGSITRIGRIEGVITDGQWHSAAFDLKRLLANKTGRRQVDEIIMADWNVTGYMKLDFGQNARNATFYVDNFKIRRGAEDRAISRSGRTQLLIDDFQGKPAVNALGATYDVFSDPGTYNCRMQRVPADKPETGNRALYLQYDVTRPGSYGGFWTRLQGRSAEEFHQFSMRVKVISGHGSFLVGLKHSDGLEIKVPAEPYFGPADAGGWRQVAVPLAVFRELRDFRSLDLFSITFTSAARHGKGEMLIEDVRFQEGLDNILVADFEDSDDPTVNRLMQRNWAFMRGAAAMAAQIDGARASHPGSRCLRLSYGGTIGLDLGGGDFSYAGWVAGLGGIDASRTSYLGFRIKGQAGREKLNLYLDDGTTRRCVRLAQSSPVTTDWQEVWIPLDAFRRQGVDLTHLEELQFVAEWEHMSATVYIDDLRFAPLPPTVLPKTNRSE